MLRLYRRHGLERHGSGGDSDVSYFSLPNCTFLHNSFVVYDDILQPSQDESSG